MMDQTEVQPGLKEMALALESVYYSKDNDEIVDSLSVVLQKNASVHLAKELLGYTYYNMQMWKNAIAYLEQIYIQEDIERLFFLADIAFWLAWSYGKTKNYKKE
jgi:hypothetical protein